MKEADILSLIYNLFNYKIPEVVVGVGDDAAVLDMGGRYIVISCDDMVDGTHFISHFLKPQEVASRLVRASISDIYAMGDAKPLYSVVSAGLKKDISQKWINGFLKGLKKELDLFGVKNIGGNLTRSPGIFLTMTVIGVVEKDRVLKREGAKVGDYLCIVGSTGFSYIATEIMRRKKRDLLNILEKKLISSFTKPPLFEEVRGIIAKFATSMIDNSDGLYKTAQILSLKNSVKVVLDEKLIWETSDVCVKRYISDKDKVIHASLVSDDYNPVFTVSACKYELLLKELPGVKRIGWIEKGKGVEIVGYEGKVEGFEHF